MPRMTSLLRTVAREGQGPQPRTALAAVAIWRSECVKGNDSRPAWPLLPGKERQLHPGP